MIISDRPAHQIKSPVYQFAYLVCLDEMQWLDLFPIDSEAKLRKADILNLTDYLKQELDRRRVSILCRFFVSHLKDRNTLY